MGINVTNWLELVDYQDAAPSTTYAVRAHYEDGGVDIPAPVIGGLARVSLVTSATSMTSFAPVASAVWGAAFWSAIGQAPVPAGSPGWHEIARRYYNR